MPVLNCKVIKRYRLKLILVELLEATYPSFTRNMAKLLSNTNIFTKTIRNFVFGSYIIVSNDVFVAVLSDNDVKQKISQVAKECTLFVLCLDEIYSSMLDFVSSELLAVWEVFTDFELFSLSPWKQREDTVSAKYNSSPCLEFESQYWPVSI